MGFGSHAGRDTRADRVAESKRPPSRCLTPPGPPGPVEWALHAAVTGFVPAPPRGSPGPVSRAESGSDPCPGPDLAVASALAGRIACACGDEGTDRRSRGARRRPLQRACAAWHRAALQGLAPGGRPAHALQQPRPGGGRGSHPPDRLRRLRPRRPQPRRPPRHRAHPARARERRDHARPERQAGRRLQDPPGRTAGADRQLAAGAALRHLGRVPPARGPGPDHVRPDDRRLVDLHRHPGHPAGHLPDLRRRR